MNGTHTLIHSPTLIHYRDTIRKLHTNTVSSLGGYSRSHKIRNTNECREFCTNTFHYKFTILLWMMIRQEFHKKLLKESIFRLSHHQLPQQSFRYPSLWDNNGSLAPHTRPQILPSLQLDPAHSLCGWLWRSSSTRNRIQRTSPLMYFLGLAGWVTVWRIYWRLHSDGTLAWTN